MKFTKEEINLMSQEELFFWAEQFAKEEKATAIRKLMIEQREVFMEIGEAKLIEGGG